MKESIYERGFNVPIIIKYNRSLTHNNMAELSGLLVSEVNENHECYDIKYYKFFIRRKGPTCQSITGHGGPTMNWRMAEQGWLSPCLSRKWLSMKTAACVHL